MTETNTEEGTASFRGFVPEVSPIRWVGPLSPSGLRDETSSEVSHRARTLLMKKLMLGNQ